MKLTQLTMTVDELDLKAIQRAIERRKSFGVFPDGDSDSLGEYIAEICRGWEEMLDLSQRKIV